MFGIRYLKAEPATYVMHWSGGRLKREGAGLAFLYYGPSSTLVAVPLGSVDVPFAFNETSADFQPLTIQGELTYRIADPKRLAALLDYSILPGGAYRTEDPERLPDRLVRAAQVEARALVGRLGFREALTGADRVAAGVLPALRASDAVAMLGVEILSFGIQSLKPAPETARALEAEAREALLRRADEAVYGRRNAAVEQERLIKESELETEIAVEEKKRGVRETQMAAEISVEERRRVLVETRAGNERKDADAKAYALEAVLRHVRDLDWRTLMALGGGVDPKLMIAVAFRELAENAGKIGEVNVSPELLQSLIGKGGKG
jgi:regulator of protease activity HflC (stomatin/prohibitin superfamily)